MIFYAKYKELAAMLEGVYLSILYSMSGNSIKYLAKLNKGVSALMILEKRSKKR